MGFRWKTNLQDILRKMEHDIEKAMSHYREKQPEKFLLSTWLLPMEDQWYAFIKNIIQPIKMVLNLE
jgi:hypothetical protein